MVLFIDILLVSSTNTLSVLSPKELARLDELVYLKSMELTNAACIEMLGEAAYKESRKSLEKFRKEYASAENALKEEKDRKACQKVSIQGG
jgi:hypothetical protein